MSQVFKSALVIYWYVLPSMKYERTIDEGPANTPIYAVKAKPPIFSDTGFAITCAYAQRNAPDNNNKTPNNLFYKLGLPVKITIPINAISKPIRFFNEGFSFKMIKAIRIPNGISDWINKVAEVASTIFKPENVNEYWRAEPKNEIIDEASAEAFVTGVSKIIAFNKTKQELKSFWKGNREKIGKLESDFPIQKQLLDNIFKEYAASLPSEEEYSETNSQDNKE